MYLSPTFQISMNRFIYTFFLLVGITSLSFGQERPSPDVALNRLIQGNRRFAKGAPQQADQSPKRRKAKIEAQYPYAVIVACSDSRVPPELVFDAGIGDLFVIRVAGNVVSSYGLESIHYALDALKAPLIVIMGHQNCGAANAVLQGQTEDIPDIAKLISPAVAEAKTKNGSAQLEEVIKLNALNIEKSLLSDPAVEERIKAKELILKAAYYNFQTGKVELLD